jgi:hypothetical protein
LRQLEDENRRLKAIVADEALDIRAPKAVPAKKRLRPAVRRQTVAELMVSHGLPERRVCELTRHNFRRADNGSEQRGARLAFSVGDFAGHEFGYS